MDTNRVSFNGIDLTSYVSNTELAHDADDKNRWHEKLAGLPQSSITVTGTWESDLPTLANIFAERLPDSEVNVWQPDGRWQSIKARLAHWWPLRWLKVRWRVYTTRGIPDIDPQTGAITVNTTAPIVVTTATRRGRR